MGLPVFAIFNVHTDVDACDFTRGLYGHRKRVCTGSWLWEKYPLPHQGLEPALVLELAFQPDALSLAILAPVNSAPLIWSKSAGGVSDSDFCLKVYSSFVFKMVCMRSEKPLISSLSEVFQLCLWNGSNVCLIDVGLFSFFSRKVVWHFLFICLSSPGDRWCDVLVFVPAGSVSSSSTLQDAISRL